MRVKIILLSIFFFIIVGKIKAGVEIREDGFYVDGKYFYPVGVNYMPRDSAVYMWKEFDSEKIEQEFKLMKEMGLNCFRTFVFWEDLNPEPGQINQETLEKIARVMDLAEENGLKVILTLNTGHMSGENWYPKWMAQGDKDAILVREPIRMFPPSFPRQSRSIYEDALARENGLLQARILASRFKDHPALLYYDLANENQYWQKPRSPELAQKYVEALVKEIKAQDSNHPVGIGIGKFLENTGFHSYGKYGINQVEDLYIVHTYPANYYPASPKIVDQYTTYYAGFENNLSRVSELAVQFQEFGMSKFFLSAMEEDEQKMRLGGYYRTMLWGALLGGANAGTLAWCFAEFAPALAYRKPYNTHLYELYFGVVDRKYQLNASGEELKKIASILKEIANEPLRSHFDPVGILLPEDYNNFPADTFLSNPLTQNSHSNHNRFLFSAYLVLRQLGINPVFLSPEYDFSGIKILIVPNFSAPSPGLEEKLKTFEARGGIIYFTGKNSLELKNALKPTEEMLERLRVKYQNLLKQARVYPVVKAEEPFVEAGILNEKYLVMINHLPYPVRTKIHLTKPMQDVSRCFYGKTLKPDGRTIEVSLGAFGVEVCELKL